VILAGGRFQVFVATRPVDFRKGMDSLAAVVQERLRLDPFSGAVFVFRAKRADRVKLLVWDGSGLTLIYKRLDEARFVWPRIEDGVMRLSPGQLGALFEGLDWKRVHSRRPGAASDARATASSQSRRSAQAPAAARGRHRARRPDLPRLWR
jgi:transposase